MKKIKWLGLGVVIVVFSWIFIPEIVKRIIDGKTIVSNRSVKPGYTSLNYIKLNGTKKQVPDFLFLNQDSLLISNDDYLDKIYVIEFFFTRCPTICPVMNENMNKVYEKYRDREDFGIVSITIDPKHDRPSVLKKYSEKYAGEDISTWNFLTGNREDIYDLANKGFNIFSEVNPNVAGGFEHQGYFALIDKKGFIRSRKDEYGNPIIYYLGIDEEGLEKQGVDMLIEDIELLINEKI